MSQAKEIPALAPRADYLVLPTYTSRVRDGEGAIIPGVVEIALTVDLGGRDSGQLVERLHRTVAEFLVN